VADLGLLVSAINDPATILIESSSGLIPDAMAEPLTTIGSRAGRSSTPVLTWLANRLSTANGMVPYSLVTAIGPDAAGDARVAALLATPGDLPPIVLNEWAQRELHVDRAQSSTWSTSSGSIAASSPRRAPRFASRVRSQ
jgi:hypothetical protein